MASHGNDNLHSSGRVPGQAQMRRDDNQNQGHSFLDETGTQVKNMAQGAADIGKGAAQGAVSMARGAALGAANIAQGAADAVKNTVAPNDKPSHDSTANANIPNYLDEFPKHNPTNPKI